MNEQITQPEVEDKLSKTIAAKIKKTEKLIETSTRILALIETLEQHVLPEQKKTFALSIRAPQKAKLKKFNDALVFWNNREHVEEWMAARYLTPEQASDEAALRRDQEAQSQA